MGTAAIRFIHPEKAPTQEERHAVAFQLLQKSITLAEDAKRYESRDYPVEVVHDVRRWSHVYAALAAEVEGKTHG